MGNCAPKEKLGMNNEGDEELRQSLLDEWPKVWKNCVGFARSYVYAT